jgi:hypothetical protein
MTEKITVAWKVWFPEHLIRNPGEQRSSLFKIGEMLKRHGWTVADDGITATRGDATIRLTRRYADGLDHFNALYDAGLWRNGEASGIVEKVRDI